MSKPLAEQIKQAERLIAQRKAALEEAEGRLEELDDKKRRYNQRTLRKAHRKRLRRDPMYRAMCRLSRVMFRDETKLGTFSGVSSQLQIPFPKY